MASELPPVIDEASLCCPLCMCSYREPRILPCLHTFCRICLEARLFNSQSGTSEEVTKQDSNTETSAIKEPRRTLPDLIEQLSPPDKSRASQLDVPNAVKCTPVDADDIDSKSDIGSKRQGANSDIEGQVPPNKVPARPGVRPPIPCKPAGLKLPRHPVLNSHKSPLQNKEANKPAQKLDNARTCAPIIPQRTPTQISTVPTKSDVKPSALRQAQDIIKPQAPDICPGRKEEDPECYYEEFGQIYEEINQGKTKVIIKQTHDDGEYYSIAAEGGKITSSFDPDVDYVQPIKTTKTELITSNVKQEIINNNNELIIAAEKTNPSPQVTPKYQRGNFLTNFFRKKNSDQGKSNNQEVADMRGIRELSHQPRSENSSYTPSPSLSTCTMPRAPIPTPDNKPGSLTQSATPDTTSTNPIGECTDGSTPTWTVSTTGKSMLTPSVSAPTKPILDTKQELVPLGIDESPLLPKRNVVKTQTTEPESTSVSKTMPPPLTPNPLINLSAKESFDKLPTISQSPLSQDITTNPLALPFSGNPNIVNCNNTHVNSAIYSDSGRTMNCPTCSTEFAIPTTGIKGLKVNSFASSLQEVVLSQSSSEKQCNNCDDSNAMFRCIDCRYYLCSGCRTAHNWLKITQTHRVMTLDELRSGRYQKELTERHEIKCNIHVSNKVELMCLYCDKPICSECKLNEHVNHRVGNLTEAAGRDHNLLKSLVDSVQTQKTLFQRTQQDVLQYKSQCYIEKKEVIEGLRHQKDSIVEAVNEAFLGLIAELHGTYEQELDNAKNVQSQLESIMTHMTHSCDLTEQLLTHGKTEDILVMSRMIKSKLNEFSFATPFELDTRPFVQYCPANFHKPMFLPMFGCLARRRNEIILSNSVAQPKTFEHVTATKESVMLHSFQAKTVNDKLGCKPSGLTLSNNDDIIIVDDTNKKVKVFDPLGIVKMELRPDDEHAFIDPWDVTITYKGHLAVTDKGARCVKVFDARGKFVNEFGPHLKSPWGIAANSRGHLIVTDILVKTVFVHDEDGNLLHAIESKGQTNLFMCPEYVKVNHNDDIIVSDFVKHCVTVFDSQGRFLFRYGSRGNKVHQFTTPCGIGVDGMGHILVADYTNNRVHKLTRDGQFVRFILSAKQGINTPQTLLVNSQGNLVVLDGPNISTFRLPQSSQHTSDTDSDVNPNYEPLEFSNKIYAGSRIYFSSPNTESNA